MLEQLKQVGMTYITWRWMWFIIPLILLVVPGLLVGQDSPPGIILGFPCMMGLIWFTAVAKWQFANPRSRLLPGYTQPHLWVFGMILLLMFVISPILLSARQGMSPWGPLAFTLLLGGCSLVAYLLGRGIFVIPAILIFFSGFPGPTQAFWFGDTAATSVIHILLVLIGGGMVSHCLWSLAQLTEEMDEYQVLPIGGMQLSRVERAEQRRLIGRQIKKAKFLGWFSDRWLDRGFANATNGSTASLAQYGFARSPGYFSACFAGIAYFLYGMLMMQFGFVRGMSSSEVQNHPPTMFILFAVLLPVAMVGMILMQHRPRMAQELLRPADRTSYLDSLLFAMAKRSALLWVCLLGALWFLAFATDTLPKENQTSLILKFITLSFAVQIPAFGLSLRLGLWGSQFIYMFGMYAVVALQMGVISLWWRYLLERGWPTLVLLILVNIALGLGIIAWARRKWLEAELG